jgi:serine/threonine protein kinase
MANRPDDISTGPYKAAPEAERDPLVGRVLKDAYQIEGKIGQGGMGVVYRATQITLGRHVAVKTIHLEQRLPDTALQRFFREAKMLSQLQHPNIVGIFDFGSENVPSVGQVHFMVMEHLTGEALDDFVRQRGALPPDLVLDLIEQLCAGVTAAHQSQVIHRDLKPANIILSQVTGSRRPIVKVLDFGLGKILAAPTDSRSSGRHLTREGVMIGTLGYSAPEQLEGGVVDARADIYSLGAVVHFLLTGQSPYPDEGFRSTLLKQLSQPPAPLAGTLLEPGRVKAVEAVVRKAMSARAEDRYPTPAELFGELLRAARPGDTLPERSRPSGIDLPRPALPPAPPRLTRRKLLLAGGAAALAGGLGGLGWWLTRPGPPPGEIVLGMSGPFSGPTRELGRSMEVGLQTCFRRVNDDGGVHGHKLRLVALDDGYRPEQAAENMRKLLDEHGALAFIGNVGTPTAELALPVALGHKRVFFGAYTGARLLRNDPPDRYVFNYRASYVEETAAIVRYLVEVEKLPADSIAVLAQDDGYGESGFQGVAKALRPYGRAAREILKVEYDRQTNFVDDAAETIVKAKGRVRAVVMVATYRPAARFIQKVKDGAPGVVFTNVSFVGSEALAEELRERGAKYASGVIVTQVVPHFASMATGVLAYRRDLEAYYPSEPPGFVSLEGYLAARVFVEGLRNAGPDLTSEALVEGLEQIKELDLGIGVKIHFGPSEHQASHKVWGTRLDEKGRFVELELT